MGLLRSIHDMLIAFSHMGKDRLSLLGKPLCPWNAPRHTLGPVFCGQFSELSVFKLLASWGFLVGSVLGAIATVLACGFNPAQIFLYYMGPYYVVCTGMQYLWPEQPNQFEKGEVLTDTLNNGAMIAVGSIQNFLTHALIAATGSGLLFHFGVLDQRLAAHNLPFPVQVLISFLTFDFMFYVTHRMAHEIDFLWRMHSVHHCAHRLSVLNASRAHPIDLIWRRS